LLYVEVGVRTPILEHLT